MDYYILFVLAAILSVLPPFFIKKYVNDNRIENIVFAIASSFVLLYVYSQIFNGYEIGNSYAIIKFLSIVLVFVAGAVCFGENITTKHVIGVIFGAVAIFLLLAKQ